MISKYEKKSYINSFKAAEKGKADADLKTKKRSKHFGISF